MRHCPCALWRLTCGVAQCKHLHRKGSLTLRNSSRMGELFLSQVSQSCIYCRLGEIALYLPVSCALSVRVQLTTLRQDTTPKWRLVWPSVGCFFPYIICKTPFLQHRHPLLFLHKQTEAKLTVYKLEESKKED